MNLCQSFVACDVKLDPDNFDIMNGNHHYSEKLSPISPSSVSKRDVKSFSEPRSVVPQLLQVVLCIKEKSFSADNVRDDLKQKV
jgi:hypothetical protein